MAKPNSNFGLVSGVIGLTLCLAQTIKGHHDSVNERERLQEAHEQKMHFLHEFHRQQLHAKEHEMQAREHRMSALEMERRAREAERRAERMVGRVLEGRLRADGHGDGKERGGGPSLRSGDGADAGKEQEEMAVWRLLESAREDQHQNSGGGEDGSGGRGDVEEMERSRPQ